MPHVSEAIESVEAKKVFVVSPIGSPGTEIYRKAKYFLDYLVRRALPAPEWEVNRADDGLTPDSISQHVVQSIYNAKLIVADLTGHNPNVFYELALAHAWKKPVVHMISGDEAIPFDIQDMRTIRYTITDLQSVDEATTALEKFAQEALDHEDSLVTPVTTFGHFAAIRSDTEDGGDVVADVLEQILSRLRSIERRISDVEGAAFRPVGQRLLQERDLASEDIAMSQRQLKDMMLQYETLLRESDGEAAKELEVVRLEMRRLAKRLGPDALGMVRRFLARLNERDSSLIVD